MTLLDSSATVAETTLNPRWESWFDCQSLRFICWPDYCYDSQLVFNAKPIHMLAHMLLGYPSSCSSPADGGGLAPFHRGSELQSRGIFTWITIAQRDSSEIGTQMIS